MKFNKTVSSAPRKSRKAHFTATSSERRQIMSVSLSKALRQQYGARSIPIRKGDVVKVVRGTSATKGKEGTVIACYRKRYQIFISGVEHNNAKGTVVNYPVHPSNCVAVTLKMNGNRQAILDRKAAGVKASAEKKTAA